jgi:hypothetical protein
VLLEQAVIIYPYGDLLTVVKPLYLVIIYFLHMAEPVTGEEVPDKYQETNLLHEVCFLVLFCFAGDGKAILLWNPGIVFPVFIKTGDLAPVHFPSFIRFAMEHVRVDAADGEPAFIDPALTVFKEIAGTRFIVLCPQCITRDIERAVLVAEFSPGRRFECVRIYLFYRCSIPVE